MTYLLPLVLAVAPVLVAQSPQWRLHAQVYPNAPSASVVTYDSLRDRVVRFGGVDGYLPRYDLTELDGDVWLSPATGGGAWPPGRASHAMAYDTRRAETILYGGFLFGPGFFTDTWRWNGSTWSQATPAHVPPPSYEPTLSYDEARARMVLFGNLGTWEWDGTDWLQQQPAHSPPLRISHAAAYDTRRARTVVFGGQAPGTAVSLDDTWEWDGVDWTQAAVASPVPVPAYPEMVYDRERGRCVLIGAAAGVGPVVFEYDGQTWSTAPAPTDAPSDLVLAYDSQRGRVVCCAGRDFNGPNSGKTWSYELPSLAVAQPYGVGCGSPALVAAADPNARPLLGSTLGVDLANVPTGVAFMCFGWSNRQVLGLSLPMRMDVFGLPGCWLLQSDDSITLPCATTGLSTARFSLAIPNVLSFVGMRCFLQPWAPSPGINPANAAIGNGVAVTLGTQ